MSEYAARTFWVGMTLKQVEEQIEIRHVLMQQMVGSLYPSILNDEIHDLYLMKAKLKEAKP
jgi:hypothetical protein